MKQYCKIHTLLVTAGLISLGCALPAEAHDYPKISQNCQKIREYRITHRSQDLALLTREYVHCVGEKDYYPYRPQAPLGPGLPASDHPDCVNATIMARLAIAAHPHGSMTREVLGLQQVICNVPQSISRRYDWQNGNRAKFGHIWTYPNGQNAKFGNFWYYPNGERVNFGNSWYYPNGDRLKFGQFWYFPDGGHTNQASLLSWACGILGSDLCQARLGEVREISGFWYDLAVVELASRAADELDYYRHHVLR